jgi:hypothetical protein
MKILLKKILIPFSLLLLFGLLSPCVISGNSFFDLEFKEGFVQTVEASVKVNGYFRKNGTYVKPHYRSNPDGNPYNNWSFPGNTNPYTGKVAPGNSSTYLKNYYDLPSSSYKIPSLDLPDYNSLYDFPSLTLPSYTPSLTLPSYIPSSTYSNYSKILCPSNSTWKAAKCYCNDGYMWNSKKTKCIKESGDLVCKNKFGTKAYSKGGQNSKGTWDCYCKAGYMLNSKKTKCIKESGNLVCKNNFGPNVYSKGKQNKNGTWSCYCKTGYEWNSGRTMCAKNVVQPKKTVVSCGRNSYFSEKKEMCVCKNGYMQSSLVDGCQKKPPVEKRGDMCGKNSTYSKAKKRCKCDGGYKWVKGTPWTMVCE